MLSNAIVEICSTPLTTAPRVVSYWSHIGATEFKQINWLPINERFSQCVCSTMFKFFKNNCPAYVDEMFSTYTQDNTTQIFSLKGQKGLSFLGPSLWNKIDTECKLIANLNTFKHSLKKPFLINSCRMKRTFICTFEIYRYFRELSVLYYMFSFCCLYSCFSPSNDFLCLCKDHYENKVVKPV